MRYAPRLCILPALACAIALNLAHGEVIYESALPGPPTGGGYQLGWDFMLGTRFHLDSPAQVQQVGGRMWPYGGQIFGGIFELASPTAFPSGNPFDAAPIALTVFTPPQSTDGDFLVPLSATLAPGDYALMFGSGRFGTSGLAIVPYNNIDVPGSSCIDWNGSNTGWQDWNTEIFGALRFVVDGAVVPEPGSRTLFAVGAALMLMHAGSRKGLAKPGHRSPAQRRVQAGAPESKFL